MSLGRFLGSYTVFWPDFLDAPLFFDILTIWKKNFFLTRNFRKSDPNFSEKSVEFLKSWFCYTASITASIFTIFTVMIGPVKSKISEKKFFGHGTPLATWVIFWKKARIEKNPSFDLIYQNHLYSCLARIWVFRTMGRHPPAPPPCFEIIAIFHFFIMKMAFLAIFLVSRLIPSVEYFECWSLITW